jgi:transposase-like protein
MSRLRVQRRLTAEQFAGAARGLRLSERNLELARAAMVDGVPVSALADAAGVSRQAVSRAVVRIYAAHLARRPAPVGWRSINVTVPPSMAERIEAEAAQALAEHELAQRAHAAAEFSHEKTRRQRG